MSKLQVGFSKVNITPVLGCGIFGYYIDRNAKGILDELFIRTLAISLGERTLLLFSADEGVDLLDVLQNNFGHVLRLSSQCLRKL